MMEWSLAMTEVGPAATTYDGLGPVVTEVGPVATTYDWLGPVVTNDD